MLVCSGIENCRDHLERDHGVGKRALNREEGVLGLSSVVLLLACDLDRSPTIPCLLSITIKRGRGGGIRGAG